MTLPKTYAWLSRMVPLPRMISAALAELGVRAAAAAARRAGAGAREGEQEAHDEDPEEPAMDFALAEDSAHEFHGRTAGKARSKHDVPATGG